MARANDGTDVPIPPLTTSSSNVGTPNGSLPDLEGVGGRTTSTMWEKFEAMLTKRFAQHEVLFAALASIPMLVQGFTRFENSILSLTQSVASITNNISNVEQAVSVDYWFDLKVARTKGLVFW